MFNNEKQIKNFTDLLWELVVQRKLNLRSALEVMKMEDFNEGKKKSCIQKTSNYLLEILNYGCELSYGLEICPFIRFSKNYTAFIGFAEKSGNIESCIDYLKEKYQRNHKNRELLVEASLYPLFVVVLAVILVFVLFAYGKNLLGSEVMSVELRAELISGSFVSVVFLVVFCVFSIWIIRRLFRSNSLYEAFLAADFLVKAGVCMSDAVGMASDILGPETKEGFLFETAREKLSWGMSLRDSFVEENVGSDRRLNQMMRKVFCFAGVGGGNDTFEKIAVWLDCKDAKNRNYFFKMVEPMFILGTGIFLLIFFINLVLPFLKGNLLGF